VRRSALSRLFNNDVLLAEKPLHEPCPETVCSCFGAFQ
jgi:hypothetical protein